MAQFPYRRTGVLIQENWSVLVTVLAQNKENKQKRQEDKGTL
jgi:hypothetical protein